MTPNPINFDDLGPYLIPEHINLYGLGPYLILGSQEVITRAKLFKNIPIGKHAGLALPQLIVFIYGAAKQRVGLIIWGALSVIDW